MGTADGVWPRWLMKRNKSTRKEETGQAEVKLKEEEAPLLATGQKSQVLLGSCKGFECSGAVLLPGKPTAASY